MSIQEENLLVFGMDGTVSLCRLLLVFCMSHLLPYSNPVLECILDEAGDYRANSYLSERGRQLGCVLGGGAAAGS